MYRPIKVMFVITTLIVFFPNRGCTDVICLIIYCICFTAFLLVGIWCKFIVIFFSSASQKASAFLMPSCPSSLSVGVNFSLESLIYQKLSNNFFSNFAETIMAWGIPAKTFWAPSNQPKGATKMALWLFLDILPNFSNYSITYSLFWHGSS